MFSFVSKTLLLRYGRRCTITSTNCNKDFAFPLFIKCLSSATSNQHSFTVSYLINSCGFSLKSALSASKLVNFNSPEKADSVIAFLMSNGFSETQISKVIRARPRLLLFSPERTLLPKLEFFNSKGFSRLELAKISSVFPDILCRSLETYLIPTFNHLSDLLKSSETAVAVIKCNPYILNHDVETSIAPSINVLQDIGVPERNIILFVKDWYRLKKISLATFKNTVEVVKEMGIDPLKTQFILAVVAKGYGRINWESKVEIYKRWGWSEEEFLSAFRKNPFCVLSSNDKIMAVMDFLVNKMDMESSAIAKRPDVTVLSMEKRFIPRAAVFQFLLSKGLINRKDTNLITLFTCPEKDFLRKFVNSYDEAPQLLKLYREKLDLLKMKKTSV
ncbi:hypothetical protein LWI29_011862 [Acer saccharum]|uniref:Uncharacterized protein n=1 Tax=Acer saccharum TaxID=4024 RepID=A0AA39TPY0_ACESA|nr:hypothetical protein LWI29_011862 [Acer saccharum]